MIRHFLRGSGQTVARLSKRQPERYAMLAVFMLLMAATSFAQTPVPIVVDTNQIFTSANTWIDVFIPIMSIGLGIGIAIAILTFIGKEILKAFRGGGTR